MKKMLIIVAIVTAIPILFIVIYQIPIILATSQIRAGNDPRKIEKCKGNLRGMQSALELYYFRHQSYPENLQVLIKKSYLQDKGDIDPWGNEYNYNQMFSKMSKENSNNYLLGSSGPDGKEDTVDDIEAPINAKRHSFKTQPETTPEVKVKK